MRRPGRPIVRWKVAPAREAKAELPLRMPALVLKAPAPSENEGQAAVVAWFRNSGFAPGVQIMAVKNEVPNAFRRGEPTLEERKFKAFWMHLQEKRGAIKGSLDTLTMAPGGRAFWIETKREGATLSALEPEQEEMILWLHAAGFPVGLAHAVPHEFEELYLAWGVPLRQRVPEWMRKPPHQGRLRWPLRDAELVAAINALREQRRRRA